MGCRVAKKSCRRTSSLYVIWELNAKWAMRRLTLIESLALNSKRTFACFRTNTTSGIFIHDVNIWTCNLIGGHNIAKRRCL